jgi:hypothetical protein
LPAGDYGAYAGLAFSIVLLCLSSFILKKIEQMLVIALMSQLGFRQALDGPGGSGRAEATQANRVNCSISIQAMDITIVCFHGRTRSCENGRYRWRKEWLLIRHLQRLEVAGESFTRLQTRRISFSATSLSPQFLLFVSISSMRVVRNPSAGTT